LPAQHPGDLVRQEAGIRRLSGIGQGGAAGGVVSVVEVANPTAQVQWQQSSDGGQTFNDIPGATATTLSFTATQGQNGDLFRVVLKNSFGTAVTLTVL
jgi:hypothetical protein